MTYGGSIASMETGDELSGVVIRNLALNLTTDATLLTMLTRGVKVADSLSLLRGTLHLPLNSGLRSPAVLVVGNNSEVIADDPTMNWDTGRTWRTNTSRTGNIRFTGARTADISNFVPNYATMAAAQAGRCSGEGVFRGLPRNKG